MFPPFRQIVCGETQAGSQSQMLYYSKHLVGQRETMNRAGFWWRGSDSSSHICEAETRKGHS